MPVKNWANWDSDSFSIVGLTTLIRSPLGSSIAAARTKASNAPETVEAAPPAKIGSSLRMPETEVEPSRVGSGLHLDRLVFPWFTRPRICCLLILRTPPVRLRERTCWQALYQASPPTSSAREKRARGRSRCGSFGLERLGIGFCSARRVLQIRTARRSSVSSASFSDLGRTCQALLCP